MIYHTFLDLELEYFYYIRMSYHALIIKTRRND